LLEQGYRQARAFLQHDRMLAEGFISHDHGNQFTPVFILL
jgi:hypothetical protein